jgi:hypothetical protein
MATPFAYKYDFVAPQGYLASGQEWTPSFGPFGWENTAITVSAHPFSVGPPGHTASALEVTRVLSRRSGEERWIFATVKNLGPDRANVQVVVGGVKP